MTDVAGRSAGAAHGQRRAWIFVLPANGSDRGSCSGERWHTRRGSVGLAVPFGAVQTDVVAISRSGSSAPTGYRFPREVISVGGRWYLRCGLACREVEELLAERGVEVDHVTIYRWVQTYTPEFIYAARPARHAAGDRWFVDETYVKVAGQWTYLYRAVDQHGQVI